MNSEFKLIFKKYWRESRGKKKICCPLCSKELSNSYMYQHITDFICIKLYELGANERIEVSKIFKNSKERKVKKVSPILSNHPLTTYELLSRKILVISDYKYLKKRLFLYSKFIDGKEGWVSGGDLKKSRIGRSLLKRAYRKLIKR